jgi:uncharacterized protein
MPGYFSINNDSTMEWFKSNFYNVLVPVKEHNEWLLYNTLNGGLEVLNDADGSFFNDVIDNSILLSPGEINNSSFLSYLYDRQYITQIDEPERQQFVNTYKLKKARLYEKDVADIGLTIGTTITCNMGCPYCFEFEKPNKSLRKDEIMVGILNYIRDMVAKSPVKKWRRLFVVWYGGEPMINAGAIEQLTPKFLDFCKEFDIEYKAMIITNGILLTQRNWELLKTHEVTDLQVTIDGPEDTHNKKRPLKNASGENYKKILSNLSLMPEGVKVTIRINVDKEISRRWDEFFTDLSNYGIWPQKFRNVDFSPSWLRPYEEIKENAASEYLTNEEFFDELQSFRLKKLQLFNAWAEKTDAPKAKLNWTLPALQEDCATWTSPYNVVIDPEGYVQKCWETIHDSKNHIRHVEEGFRPEDFASYSSYNKTELNSICSSCQYLPVCDKLPCAFDALKHGKPDCTYWKTKLPSSLKDQYVFMKKNPSLMVTPNSTSKANTGHSNK